MSRFNELKAKGYSSLSKEEKLEYQQLNKALDNVVSDPSDKHTVPTAAISEEKITISKKELAEMIASQIETMKVQNDSLRKDNVRLSQEQGLGEWREEDPSQPIRRFAFQHLYQMNSEEEPGLIIGLKRFEIQTDPKSGKVIDQIYNIMCLYGDGSTKEHRVSYSALMGLQNREKVEIINPQKKRIVKIHGKVRRASTDKEGYTRSVNFSQGAEDFNDRKQNDGEWVDL